MRVLILGAGGMLGCDLRALAPPRHEVVAFTHADADVTDAPGLGRRIGDAAPDVVINCAAATDVDRCEREPEWAYAVNARGAGSVGEAAAAVGGRLIHISTDFVFSGETDRPYTEEDAPDPVNAYGASKLAGEDAVRLACPPATIVRTQWLYGRHGKSFPRAILNAARAGKPLKVVADQFGAPTYTRDLARKLLWLAEQPIEGIVHVANAGECSRYDWAVELLRLAGRDEVPVQAIRAEEWPAPARRPRRSTLSRAVLQRLGADDLPPWRRGVAEFIEELRTAGEL
jgi:dTDP-4-dehydrorhamnose reductase